MVMRLTNTLAAGVAAMALALGFAGCKSNEAAPAKEQPAAEKPAAPAKAAPSKPAAAAAPASSPLSKVATNMSPEQVQQIMGSPTGQGNYPTGKTFNPYNFGNDSGNRLEYK